MGWTTRLSGRSQGDTGVADTGGGISVTAGSDGSAGQNN
jgi:hypothetical protein